MKKPITSSLFVMLLCLTLCVGKTNAQTTIYDQNFDASITDLPSGWTAYFNGTATTTASWLIDTTNSSYVSNGNDGYAGASGLNNVKVENIWASGTYELRTANISTVNYKNIETIWGSRVTKHFYDGGSYIQGFYMSTNNGVTWDSIPYTEGAATSLWYLDNNQSNIVLPVSAAQQPHLMFKWIADIYPTASGTYRIDDFQVFGTSAPAGINDVNAKTNAYVYVVNNSAIKIVAKDIADQKLTVELFDMLGNNLGKELMSSSTLSMNVSTLSTGIYLVKVSNGTDNEVTKVSLTR